MFDWLKKKITPTKPEGKAYCPYCKDELYKDPIRKQKCKSCGKEFLVRTHYLTRQKLILTDKEAVKYDHEKEKYYTAKSLIEGLKLDICVDGKTVDDLVEKTTIEFTKKWGHTPSLGDVAWSVANRMVLDAMKKGDLGLIKSFHFQMALYLHDSGKDGNYIREKSFEMELKEYQRSGIVNKVIIITADDSCEQCKSQKDKILSIEEAIKTTPLPCKSCTFKFNEKAPTGWCRCCYAPSIN